MKYFISKTQTADEISRSVAASVSDFTRYAQKGPVFYSDENFTVEYWQCPDMGGGSRDGMIINGGVSCGCTGMGFQWGYDNTGQSFIGIPDELSTPDRSVFSAVWNSPDWQEWPEGENIEMLFSFLNKIENEK